MVKHKFRLLQAALLLLICAFALALLPAGAHAESGAALVVHGASGKAGDTVGVTVSLRGIKSLPGVEGLSGGEFELHYDPAVASIGKISKGSIVGTGFMFLENKNFSESSAKVTLAAVSGLITKDGDLCNVTFTLKKTGPVEVSLKEIAFYDQDVRALTVGTASELPKESPSGEGSPGSGAGTAVELHPPGDASPPSGDPPDTPGGFGEPAGETESEGTYPGGEPAGEAPAAPEDEAAKTGSAENARKWILPAVILLVIAATAAGAAYIWRRRSRNKMN